MKEITLFISNSREDKYNTSYPKTVIIRNCEDFKCAMRFDHVAAEYSTGKDKHGNDVPFHRSIDTFVRSNCLMMDVDNDRTDNPEEWISPNNVGQAFNSPFYISYTIPQ